MVKKEKIKRAQHDDLATRKPVSKVSHSKHPVSFPLPFPTGFKYPKHAFLRNEPPYEDSFQQALDTSYEGFCVDGPHVMKNKHSRVEAALLALERANYFRVDVTQPFGLGTKCAKTYVTRCLVGEPGTTYKYLGLRMFSHSWRINQPFLSSTSPLSQEQKALETIGDLNGTLTERTKKLLADLDMKRTARGADATRGRLGFDVALINRMETTIGLKDEPSLGQGKCSVSWHADSSLEHFSSIAVYHLIDKEADAQGKWSVGLRVAHNSEGPQASRRGTDIAIETETPPLAVSLPSGSTYYLLDDFNHHHQHAVIADGKVPGRRFSSTHRLLRESHNVHHILARCKTVCANFHKKGPKVWRSEQLLLTEMESEWLRQFYIQGQAHHDHLWKDNWQGPIEELLKYWSLLEERSKQTVDWLQLGAEGRCGMDVVSATDDGPPPPRSERKLREKRRKAREGIEELLGRGDVHDSNPKKDLYESLATLLEDRAILRKMWLLREQDGVFHDLSREYRPIPLPVDFLVVNKTSSIGRGQSPMPGSPNELRDIASRLRSWGKAYEFGDKTYLPDMVSITTVVKENCKPLDWTGWESQSFGLEMQHPWAMQLLSGQKKIETRAYRIPPALIGRKVFILQSPNGDAGVSALDDILDLGTSAVAQVGWCTFESVVSYRDQDAFEADREFHLVEGTSGYGWIAGVTKVIYGWVVGDYGTIQSEKVVVHSKAIRRHRSFFELQMTAEISKRKSIELNSKPLAQQNRSKRQKKK